MIGHLGTRASALLDGHLGPAETERAWAHVHVCHACRDLVEREAWVKSRLSRLSQAPVGGGAPDGLKGSLLAAAPAAPAVGPVAPTPPDRSRSSAALLALGGGAVGFAVVGVLALGTAPAAAPSPDRRLPTAQTPAPGGGFTPASVTRVRVGEPAGGGR